jgi:UDP-N-acetylglucosamine 1-carboxyvinyltransferase
MVGLDAFEIDGPCRLDGTVAIEGAKNFALPAIAAAILTDGEVRLTRVPHVQDVTSLLKLLSILGGTSTRTDGGLVLSCGNVTDMAPPYDLVRRMRASILLLGPMLARFGRARIPLPGGCAIGTRPVDLHIAGLKHMGVEVEVEHGDLVASTSRLVGASYTFPKVTVTGTENLLMAACLAKGITVLHNCAQEPEVEALTRMLMTMGARIEGAGRSELTIEGVPGLSGCDCTIIPDRIEAGTYLLLGAMLKGSRLRLEHVQPQHLGSALEKLEDCGVRLAVAEDSITITDNANLAARPVVTAPYPGFATDLQAQYIAAMTQASGVATVEETIFEKRFQHVMELQRMGADISLSGRTAVVRGGARLSGAPVMASDLRASASLVMAGLAAEGRTLVQRIYHLDRGYAGMEEKLKAVGAVIRRVRIPGV